MKTTRLKDIAKNLGVSKTAVSRVLNNLPIRISKEKREAILNLAKSLEYRPNLIARGLRNKKTKCIGIIVPDMSTLFYPQLIRLIEKQLSLHGYRAIICDTENELSQERLYVEDLLARYADGMIVAPASGEGNISMFENLAKSLPIILMDRNFPGEKLNYVVTDNRLASRKAVRIIARKKPSHLFYLGEKKRNFAIDERLMGVREEASLKKIPFTGKDILLCDTTREDEREKSKQIFSRKVKNPAIFLESNRLLMGLLDIAYKRGLTIPEDFTVIGFDTFRPELATPSDFNSLKVINEPTPVVRQPVAEMAALVTEYMLSPGKRRKWRIKLKAQIEKQ